MLNINLLNNNNMSNMCFGCGMMRTAFFVMKYSIPKAYFKEQ